MKLVIATKNKGKLEEIKESLKEFPFEIVSSAEMGIFEEIEENGTTFEENAFIKARRIAYLTKEAALADDSGLLVDFLNNEPGVHTARYAGEHATDEENITKLLSALCGVPQEKRTARFKSVIACVFPDGKELSCEGVCEGVIAFSRRGTLGFGYDPVFFLPERNKTFAELTPEEKNTLSHRGRALDKLKNTLKKEKYKEKLYAEQ